MHHLFSRYREKIVQKRDKVGRWNKIINRHTVKAPRTFLNSRPGFAIVTRPLFPINKLIPVDAWTNTHSAIP